MTEQPIALDGQVLEAFIEHLREHFRAELLAELEAAEAAAWEPVREQLQRTRQQRTWAEIQQARQNPEKGAAA